MPKKYSSESAARKRIHRIYRELAPFFLRHRTTRFKTTQFRTKKAGFHRTSKEERDLAVKMLAKRAHFTNTIAAGCRFIDIAIPGKSNPKIQTALAIHEATHALQNLKSVPARTHLIRNLGTGLAIDRASVLADQIQGRATGRSIPAYRNLMPTAVEKYFSFARGKRKNAGLGSKALDQEKMAKAVKEFFNQPAGWLESHWEVTPYGRKNGYQAGSYLGKYAATIEKKAGIKNTGLVFLAFLSEGKSLEVAEDLANRWARRKKPRK